MPHGTVQRIDGSVQTIDVFVGGQFVMEDDHVPLGRMRMSHFAAVGTVALVGGNVATINVS